MKTIRYFIMMAVVLLTAACSNDDDFSEDVQNNSERMVRITVGTPQTTRISYDDDAVKPFAWENGDKLLAAQYAEDGSYIGSSEFVMDNYSEGSATFYGIIERHAANVKLYYDALNMKLDASGKAVIDYSRQTQDLNNPGAHLKDYMLMASDMITFDNLVDEAIKKTVSLKNSMLRVDVKSFPETVGTLKSISLVTNLNTLELNISNIAISNAKTAPFKVFMMFDPDTNIQKQGGSFKILFEGDKSVSCVSKDGMPAASFNEGGTRYNLTVFQNEQDVTKGLNNWENINYIINEPTNTIYSLVPGSITHDMIVQAIGTTNNLKIVGKVNGKDIKAIREATGCPSELTTTAPTAIIKTLDMADATIVASEDVYYKDKEKEYKTTDNSIGSNMFRSSQLTSIVMPKNITSIGESAFQLSTLKSVSVPAEVSTIGDYAFQASRSMEGIVFEGNKLQEFSSYMLSACRSLKEVTIPISVTTIRYQSLAGTPLESVVIPKTVKRIYNGAFSSSVMKTMTIECDATAQIDNEFMVNNGPNNVVALILDSSWMNTDIAPVNNKWKGYAWNSISFEDFNKPVDGDDASSSLGGIDDNGNLVF